MIIKSLTAVNFGKLHDKKLNLREGLNIIAAPNEWGKTTWAAFIEAMLYGVDTSERQKQGAIPFKQKYAPLNGLDMAGAMEFYKNDGSIYEIQRSQKGKTPLGNIKMTRNDSGNEVPVNGEPGEELFGIGRHGFRQTYFTSQLLVKTESSGEVEKKLQNLSNTGQEEISYSDITKKLENLRKPLTNRQGGRQKHLEDERIRLLSAFEMAREDLKELEDLRAAIEVKQAEYNKALASQNAVKIRAAYEKYGKISMLSNEIDRREQQRQFYEDQLDGARIEDMEKLDDIIKEITDFEFRINENLVILRMKEQELFSIEDEYKLNDSRISGEIERISGAAKGGFILPVILSVLSALAFLSAVFVFSGNLLKLISAAAGVALALACVISFVIFVFGRKAKEREKKDRLASLKTEYERLTEKRAKASVLKEDIVRFNLSGEAITAQLEGKKAEASVLIEKIGIEKSSPKQSLDAKKKLYNEYITSLSMLNSATTAYDAACTGENIEKLKQLASECTEEIKAGGTALEYDLDKISYEMVVLRDEKAKLEGNLAGRGRIDEISGRIAEIDRELYRIRIHVKAIDFAIGALKESYDEISARFSPAFSSKVSSILKELTQGAYDKVRISKDMEAEVGRENSLYAGSIYMSAGTVDQIYLAMRLALCGIADNTNVPPVILDDALTNFDDDRAKAAIDFLARYAERRQIILFTCHRRVTEYAALNRNVNLNSFI